MGRKRIENRKDNYLKLRVSKDEMELLKAIAISEGISVADLVREGLGLAKARRAIDGRLDAALEKLE